MKTTKSLIQHSHRDTMNEESVSIRSILITVEKIKQVPNNELESHQIDSILLQLFRFEKVHKFQL